jgi:predicted dehydrogenase
MTPPIRIGIIGMGGYAGAHHNAVIRLEEKHHARLVCTCDPGAQAFASQQELWRFPARGVKVFSDYRAMLDACGAELDLLVVPTPIPLHAEMHRAGVERGIPVYLEKPPTLDYVELEEMIQCDRAARKATQVGFNFIIEKPRLALKRRLLNGDFGTLRETHFLAQWARPTSYFSRNGWAGRLLTQDGKLVLDSCFGNAMAHFVHNMLFWAGGPELMSWASLASVQAELYRAHDIEGADTFFVEAAATSDVLLRFALTHACSGPSTHMETVVCDKASIRYTVGRQIEILWKDGRVECTPLEPFDTLVENHLEYYRYLRGETSRPATLLSDARPFVIINNLAYVASQEIAPIPADRLSLVRNEKEQKDYLSVNGLPSALEEFLSLGRWPGEHGWTRQKPALRARVEDLPKLLPTVKAMAAR